MAEDVTLYCLVEIPKGSRNKYGYNEALEVFELRKVLPRGMLFPYDFGFIPSTLGEDGDPLDVMVIMDAPAHVGCLIQIRIIGIIEAKQTEHGETARNDRLLGVAIHSYDYEDLTTMEDVSKTLLDQVEAFFVSYNQQRGKRFNITGTGGSKKALKFLRAGINQFDEKATSKKKSKK